MMHYFIDGYNLLFRLVGDQGLFREQRQGIIVDFSKKLHLLNLDSTIVFDAAYRKEEASRSHYRNLEIVYTSYGETADEYILSEISRSRNPKNETVVTSDKKLASQARHLSAKTETVEKFHQQMNRSARNKKEKSIIANQNRPPLKKAETGPPLPVLGQTKEGCFEFYLEVFEERFRKLEEKNPWNPPISEFQRWLTVFEERLKES